MQETSLHAALKNYYAQPGDQQEVPVDGYQIDVVSGELLIEIQTRNFTALKTKLPALLASHPLLLVHPIALEKWIVSLDAAGRVIRRRKSPRRGRLEHLFLELVRIPQLIEHPNFSLEIVFTREDELRRDDGLGSWRRKGWSIADRRLLQVVGAVRFNRPEDFMIFFPDRLPELFTSREFAQGLNVPLYLAYKMLYCLRQAGLIAAAGKRGRAQLYSLNPQPRSQM